MGNNKQLNYLIIMENKFKDAINQIATILNVKLSEKTVEETIVEKKDEVELAVEDQTAPAVEAEQPTDHEAELQVVADLQNRVAALEAALQQLMGELSMAKENAVKLSQIVETIANMPAGEPIKRTETMSTTVEQKSNDMKFFSGNEQNKMESIFRAIKK